MIEVFRDRLREPTSRGLADAVSTAIRDGAVQPGQKLPPIRSVAGSLGVSPTTVSAAWSLLARAGTIRTDGRRGTTIASLGGAGPSRYRRAFDRETSFSIDLSTGVPDPRLLPDLTPALQRLRGDHPPASYLADPVLPALLTVFERDWPYAAERFTVTDGAMDALDLICATMLRFGDRVAVEHPCFPPLLDLLDANGIVAIGVRVDDEGPVLADVEHALASGARALFLQPRAQNPTGMLLSAKRAGQLAARLADADALAIEDDSAGAMSSAPPISLGRWVPDRVLHVTSFSKSHGPDLRLAALSGPRPLIDAITERRHLGQGWTSRLLQSLLVDLLTNPVAIREVENARRVYAERRTAMVAALAAHGVPIAGSDGLNIWLPVRDESAALVRLASRGIGVAAGSPFMVLPGGQAHLRVTVGLVADQHEHIAAELAAAADVGSITGPR
ncbi:MAG: GntR family transcriptional regulator [Frankiales bacterium]|nr:GntR family transcriptional regulator [Frankiales bacterium]